MSMAQNLFKVGLGTGQQPTCAQHFQKYLRHQAINQAPPKRVKAGRDGPLRLEEKSSDETNPSRSVPLLPRPTKVCPINWILLSYSNSSICPPAHQPVQGLFKGGFGCRAIAQMCPAFPKLPRAPSAFL